MQIPNCISDKEHCWHPGSSWVEAPQHPRCCHCGLNMSIRRKRGLAGAHGKHVGLLASYELVFDDDYQKRYLADPKFYDEELPELRKEAQESMREFRKQIGDIC